MTKEQFLEGREFKMSNDSILTYKYDDVIMARVDDKCDYKVEGLAISITDKGFTGITTLLGSMFEVEIMFNDLILV